MKKIAFRALIVILSSSGSQGFCQERRTGLTTTPIFQSSFTQLGAAAWGAGGAHVAKIGLPTASILNPAGLDTSSFSVYVESGKRLKSDYFVGLDFDNQFILPGFVAITKSLNRFVLSLGYAKSYDLYFETDILVTTGGAPDGTGQLISASQKLKLHTLWGAAKYQLNKHFSLGLTVATNYLKENQEFGSLVLKGDGLGFGFIAGGVVTVSEALTLATAFRYIQEIDYDLTSSQQSLLGNDIDRGASPLIISNQVNHFDAKFPWSIQTGLTFRPAQSLSISAMLDHQRWSSSNAGLENKTQLHFGLDYRHSSALGFSLGFFTMDNPATVFGSALDQDFLTVGISGKLHNRIELSASIIDAHLLTNNDFQQTYFVSGIQYSFRTYK